MEAVRKGRGIKPAVFDSIINKTPLAFRTNRIIGGVAPADYLAQLVAGDAKTPGIDVAKLDAYLRSHLIDPAHLHGNDFDAFMQARQKRLLGLIEEAMGKSAYTGDAQDEGEDAEGDADAAEAEMVIAV